MSLESVLIIIFLSPIALGVLKVIFDGNSATPIIIDYRPSQPANAISKEKSDSEDEFLNQNAHVVKAPEVVTSPEMGTKLEEDQQALEILQELEQKGEQGVSKPLQYEASEIPEALNESLDELFKAISNGNSSEQAVSTSSEDKSLKNEQKAKPMVDLPEEQPTAISSVDEFEASVPSIDEMLEQISTASEGSEAKIYNFPFGENVPLPPREYLALQRKYGPEVVNKVTTTPGIGGTGDYDCMIGRVSQKENLTLLQYGDHFIPLKGMNRLEGVFLVEGMFIKPDLFFVSNYTDLAKNVNSFGHAAEK